MTDKKIEDFFNEFLIGDTLKNALDFAEFLMANEMMFNGDYEIHYKDKLVCYVDTPNAKRRTWRVWTVGDYSKEYEGFPIEEGTKEIAWENVVKCADCGNCDDAYYDPGKTEMIFGKVFIDVCKGADNLAMRFTNPDAETLECTKKMVDMRKYAFDNII